MNLISMIKYLSGYPFFMVMALLLLSIPVAAENVAVEAQLDRKEIQLGGHAFLNVKISGDSRASVDLPQVNGLSIQPQGHSTQMQFANGHMTSSISHRYQVKPSKEGDFIIPPITINSDGKKISSKQQLTLKVTKGAPTNQVNPNVPEDLGELAFMDVVGLKDQAVVGELIPVEVRFFFKSGIQVSLDSAPALEGSSFIMKTNDDKARQGTATKDGIRYTVVIFKSSISPIKTGEFDLSFNMGATLHIEDRTPRRRSRRSAFGDEFFGSLFTPRVRKSVKLASDPHKLTVTAPPSDSQPDGFNGTIGQFSIAARASASTVRAGDPITLVTRVSGKGDLDRVPMPHMSDSSGWKTYPAKHEIKKSYTTASDGTKLFNQVIVPKNESVTEIPSLELVYFDPDAKEYRTARTNPIPIKVTPGTDITEEAPQSNIKNQSPTTSPLGPSIEVPNTHLGWLRSERIDQASWFLGTIGGLIAVLITWPILTLWQRRHNTPERKATAVKDKQIKSALLDMEQSIKNQNAVTFFEAARRTLQTQWSKQLNIAPNAVTGSDLPNDTAKSVFNTADSVVFSGDTHSSLDLEYWKQQTLIALESLNTTNQ